MTRLPGGIRLEEISAALLNMYIRSYVIGAPRLINSLAAAAGWIISLSWEWNIDSDKWGSTAPRSMCICICICIRILVRIRIYVSASHMATGGRWGAKVRNRNRISAQFGTGMGAWGRKPRKWTGRDNCKISITLCGVKMERKVLGCRFRYHWLLGGQKSLNHFWTGLRGVEFSGGAVFTPMFVSGLSCICAEPPGEADIPR